MGRPKIGELLKQLDDSCEESGLADDIVERVKAVLGMYRPKASSSFNEGYNACLLAVLRRLDGEPF